MINIENVSMDFPLPSRFKDILTPFKAKKFTSALSEINLKINEGDKVAFLGINGTGKTTLLKLIGGLLYPSKGKIEVNNYNTITHNLNARRNVGFVLNEERSFYWRLTGVQNLEFFGSLDNLYGENLKYKIEELISLVGLEKSGNKLVASYSSGMKQRLAIARGLLSDPKILILDEPTRTLDPEAVEDVMDLISKKIHEDMQRTLLIATHRFDEAEALCNKICVMKNGKILAFDSIQKVVINYGNIADFYYSTMKSEEGVLV